MRRIDLLLILLSASVNLPAQQRTVEAQPPGHALPAVGCPVNFGAKLDGRAVLRSAEDAKRDGTSPLLQLTFLHPRTPLIKGATVVVHGLSAAGRYLPVDEQSAEDRTQTFELDRQPHVFDLVFSEVSVDRMALVRWAEVTELRYADGSSWHASGMARCRAVPSGFHLVNLSAQ